MADQTKKVKSALYRNKPDEVSIAVYLPDKALRRAFALDLPSKVKSKVLSSIMEGPSNPGTADLRGEWGETWGETLPMD